MYGDGVDDETEERFYMERLEAGLFTLQQIDYIMLEICGSGPSSVSCHDGFRKIYIRILRL